MKQLTTLILSLLVVFSMCACGSQEPPAETIPAAEETTVPVTEESVPETTVPETTVPEEAEAITVHFVTTTDTEVSQEADDLSVTLQNDQLSVTVSDLVVQEDYVTNQASTPERRSEYLWEIQLFMEDTAYSLSSISWAFEPGAERIRTIADFDHAFSKQEGGFWVRITDSNGQYVIPSVTYTPDSITWTVTLPRQFINMSFDEIQAQKDAGTNEYVLEDFTFDIRSIKKANVLIFNFPENHNELRTYQPAAS